jgi:hypothetical protein
MTCRAQDSLLQPPDVASVVEFQLTNKIWQGTLQTLKAALEALSETVNARVFSGYSQAFVVVRSQTRQLIN